MHSALLDVCGAMVEGNSAQGGEGEREGEEVLCIKVKHTELSWPVGAGVLYSRCVTKCIFCNTFVVLVVNGSSNGN